MGGAGESLTKSVKRALKVITLDIAFTDEVLYTSFAKPNALSKKRPLSCIKDDVNDFDTLTPNHFFDRRGISNQLPGEFSSKETHAFLYRQHFYKQHPAEIGKKSSRC